MFTVKFRGKTFIVCLVSQGFKVNVVGTGKWNYIHYDDIKNYVNLLNNTGKIKLSVPLNERSAFNLPNDLSVFRNIALLVRLLYPEFVSINDKYVVSNKRINFEFNDFINRRNKLLLNEKEYVIEKERVFCKEKGQTELTQFR